MDEGGDLVVEFEGIRNFRDFGGYAGGSGCLKRGRLYRSAHHAHATDADLDAMAKLDLAVVVNLMRPSERQLFPSRLWTGFAATVIDNDNADDGGEAWADFLQQSDLSAASFRAYFERFYRCAGLAQRYVDLFRRYFHALAQAEGAVLVHCAGGKDRTGIVAALTHHLAGVRRDDIMADFLLTNDPAHVERVVPAFAAHIVETTGRVPNDAAMRVAASVEAHYLEAAFDAITTHCGSVDEYFRTVLDVDGDKRTAIEMRLLE
jgi:protein-tyrosine phosphatase